MSKAGPKKNEYMRKLRQQRALLGQCVVCAAVLSPLNRRYCETHRRIHAEHSRRGRLRNPKIKDAAYYERVRQRSLLYAKRYPEKIKAQNTLRNAIRRGKIVRPSCCSECLGAGRIDAHHADYSKPLDVEWLCRSCHTARHRSIQ